MCGMKSLQGAKGAEYAQVTNAEQKSLCNALTVVNAAAQLQYGICNGYYGDDGNDRCVEWNPSMVPRVQRMSS